MYPNSAVDVHNILTASHSFNSMFLISHDFANCTPVCLYTQKWMSNKERLAPVTACNLIKKNLMKHWDLLSYHPEIWHGFSSHLASSTDTKC